MTDTLGNQSTTASIIVGGTYNDSLETFGDRDWIRITLTAGQSITVFVDGITLEDSYLRIHNSAGTLLYENDDIVSGVNRDSQLSFTATTSGTYYIDVGAFDDAYTGTYQVSVSPYTPPPVYTYDQIADQLVNGYWGGDSHHFDVTQGGSITVNITALTPSGQSLALAALGEWSHIIGVTFVPVLTGGQITFDDNQSGAFTDGSWSGGIIASSHVNVSTAWLAQYGTGLNTYSYQTYIHEIGHALGLGHAGNYNGSANYPFDALYQNDCWATSVMSYFSQTENTYFAGQGFTENFLLTPMIADVVAVSMLYGLSTTWHSGDNTYAFGSGGAQCIFDAGGTDWLYGTGYSGSQLINLNPGTFSNLQGQVGNVAIALGTVIENAVGGSGNDTMIGNGVANHLEGNVGNDVLDGGAGADTMIGGLGDDKYYIDNGGDVVVEAANEGDDLVFVLGTYTLAQGVSIETLVALNQSSTDPLVLTGNEFGQSLYGNLGDNYLNGGQGNDFLVGLAGNDNLLGGTGADDMQGGTGNDVYYADQAGDRIFETAGQGSDLVVATASYTLTDGAEVETMSVDPNAGSINLTGNEYAQSIYGNAGNNIITGMGGADYLVGGSGNDTYYVDPSDFIGEDVGGGDDTIVIATSYILREGNEIETLVALNQDSTDPVNLTGNEFGQSLYGSQGNNMLNGGGGNDFLVGLGGNDFLIGGPGNDNMQGGQGNDLYYVEDSGDQIFENAGEGDDLAVCFASFALGAGQSVETLSAVEGTANINLTGNSLGQSLYGNAGDNVLTSGGGADYMAGGAGNDTFVLTNAPGVSTIADYSAGDVVDISQYLSVANGTNVVAGGYVKIVGTQLQVDANGGGDQFVTIGNVSGSGSVTIRYQSGGSPTDLGVARSASQSAQSMAMASAVAAAGMAALVPTDAKDGAAETSTIAPSDVDVQHSQAFAPVALDDGQAQQASSLMPLAGSIVAHLPAEAPAFHAPVASSAPAVLDRVQAQGPAELLQATSAPAHEQIVAMSLLAAPGIAMPSAERLAALGGGGGPVEGVQHNQIVSQVLADAILGGEAHGPNVDMLLSSLPGSGGLHAGDALASHFGGPVGLADMGGFHGIGGDSAVSVMLIHPDAVAPA